MERLIDFEDGISSSFRCRKSDLPADGFLLSRGRDAVAIICQELRSWSTNRRVLVPAFICEVVPRTLIENGINVGFYDITANLEIDLESVGKNFTDNTSAILFINYFGFLQPEEKILELARYKVPIIEDNTQAFLSGSVLTEMEGVRGWTFTSYRKLLPVPEGSQLSFIGKNHLFDAELHRPGMNYVTWRLFALFLKSAALKIPHHYVESVRQEFFTRSVRSINFQYPARIAQVSKAFLRHIDIEKVFRTRRTNYLTLLESIRENHTCRPIFDCLMNNVCPLGLPVLVKNRNELLHGLETKKISAALLWNRNTMVKALDYPVSAHLWDHILVLPVGQAYSAEDMFRMSQTINEVL